jgi:RNA polymerase primary sigma factor
MEANIMNAAKEGKRNALQPVLGTSVSFSGSEKKTLQTLLAEPISYSPDERFADDDFMAKVMQQKVSVTQGTYLDSATTEILFLQMHYARHHLCRLRRELLDGPNLPEKAMKEMLRWHNIQLEARGKLICANVGLVLAMAKHVGCNYRSMEFTELISEGSLALMRATERFNHARGIRFSTYACHAILKSYARLLKQNRRYHQRFGVPWDAVLERDNSLDLRREQIQNDLIDELRTVLQRNLAALSRTERCVVEMRFSLDGTKTNGLTLQEIGVKLGLTKERIRQIQNQALAKLRAITQERLLAS